MPELPPIDKSILELLASVRHATEVEQAAEARRLAEQTQADIASSSIETLVANETLTLKALMIAGTRRQQKFESKRTNQRVGQVVNDYPHLNISKSHARKLIKRADTTRSLRARTIVTEDFITCPPEGLPGEELTQSWYAELDLRPVPKRDEETNRARLRIFCAIGSTALETRYAVPVYGITASRSASGQQSAEVLAGDVLLTESELFTPLGFVLAAQKKYEQ